MTAKDETQKELHPAEIAKIKAETAKETAETRKLEAEAQKAENEVAFTHIQLMREMERREMELANHFNARDYLFGEQIGAKTALACKDILATWSRMDKLAGREPGPMTITFTSPGGSVIDGFALFDFIRHLQNVGHHITIRVYGYAASMAGILLQVGDRRIMGREAYLLIHQGSGGLSGSMGEIKDTVKWFEKIDSRILDIFTEVSNRPGVDKPLSRAKIKAAMERTDWWLDSVEALKHGFVDEVE